MVAAASYVRATRCCLTDPSSTNQDEHEQALKRHLAAAGWIVDMESKRWPLHQNAAVLAKLLAVDSHISSRQCRDFLVSLWRAPNPCDSTALIASCMRGEGLAGGLNEAQRAAYTLCLHRLLIVNKDLKHSDVRLTHRNVCASHVHHTAGAGSSLDARDGSH